MEISQTNQVITLTINETDSIHYYERFYAGSKLVSGSNGTVLGNSFRYEGLHVKKYGRGRLKNEVAFYETIEKADEFIRSKGFQFY